MRVDQILFLSRSKKLKIQFIKRLVFASDESVSLVWIQKLKEEAGCLIGFFLGRFSNEIFVLFKCLESDHYRFHFSIWNYYVRNKTILFNKNFYRLASLVLRGSIYVYDPMEHDAGRAGRMLDELYMDELS